jgi:hypothetical protein
MVRAFLSQAGVSRPGLVSLEGQHPKAFQGTCGMRSPKDKAAPHATQIHSIHVKTLTVTGRKIPKR